MSFLDNVLQLCEQRGEKLTPLMKQLELSPGNVQRWRDGATVNSKILMDFSNHFGVSVDFLLNGKSVQDLADAIGMSRVYTSALINGRVQSEATMKLISDTLNIESPEKRKSDSWCKSVRIAMVKRGWSVLSRCRLPPFSWQESTHYHCLS